MAKQTINPRLRVILWLLAVFSGVAAFSVYTATSDWTWTPDVDLVPKRDDSSATLLGNGKVVLVAGGTSYDEKQKKPFASIPR